MPLAREQRRLATVVFIDVVGYARLMGQNESGTHALVKTHLAERDRSELGRRANAPGPIAPIFGPRHVTERDLGRS